MTSHHEDRIMQSLAGLTPPAPARDRVERTRARCHSVLARYRKRQQSLEQERPTVARLFDVLVLLALAVYLAGAVSEAVWLGSFF